MSITIVGNEDFNGVRYYQIQIEPEDGKKWVVKRRFNHFRHLREKLTEKFPRVPALPGCSWSVKSEKKIVQRQAHLASFIQAIDDRADIMTSEEMVRFLELDNYAAHLLVAPPKQTSVLQLPMRVKRVCYVESSRLLLVLVTNDGPVQFVAGHAKHMYTAAKDKKAASGQTEEQKAVTKAQQGEKLKGKVNTSVFAYQLQSSNPLEMLESPNCVFKLDCTNLAQCMQYNEKSKRLVIGFKNGKILHFEINLTNTVEEQVMTSKEYQVVSSVSFELHDDMKLHKKAVTGLHIVPEKEIVWTISSDTTLNCFDLNAGKQVFTRSIDASPLRCMASTEDVLYIGSEGGIVIAMSIRDHEAVELTKTSCFSESPIMDIDLSPAKDKLYTTNDDGVVCGFQIEKPSGELNLQATATDKYDIETLCVGDEIYVSDESGNIQIWNNAQNARYIWKAHEGSINDMQMVNENVLMTGGIDGCVVIWDMSVNKGPGHYQAGTADPVNERKSQKKKTETELAERASAGGPSIGEQEEAPQRGFVVEEA